MGSGGTWGGAGRAGSCGMGGTGRVGGAAVGGRAGTGSTILTRVGGTPGRAAATIWPGLRYTPDPAGSARSLRGRLVPGLVCAGRAGGRVGVAGMGST